MTSETDNKVEAAVERVDAIACRGGACICPQGQCDMDMIRQAIASLDRTAPESAAHSPSTDGEG